jgi:DNA-binding transcriptional LysR family regulator
VSVNLEIDLLRSFVVVAETGVLSRAADRLGRTQAAISMQMKRLEGAIDHSLLIRTGRGVTLTMQGERLLTHARRILGAHDEATAELAGDSLSGNLRFGCPDDYAAAFLPSVLRSFSRRHPHVSIEVICAPTPRLCEQLRNQLLDIALVSLPDGAPPDRCLRRERLVWVGCKGADVTGQDPLPLALSDRDTLDYQAATFSLNQIGRAYRIAYASGSMAGLTAVVRSGQAIAVLTQSAVPGDLKILPASRALPALPGVCITIETSKRNSSNLLASFEEHVRSMLPTL